MIGIQDSTFHDREFWVRQAEATRDGQRLALQREWENEYLIQDWKNSAVNFDRQRGEMKSFQKLEKELQEIDQNIKILAQPDKPTKAYVYYGEHKVCPTDRMMPEWSHHMMDEEDVPIIYDGIVSLDAPATEKKQRVWREIARGWRTVLVKLVQKGFLTPTQVDRKFGLVGERNTYSRGLGRIK